MDGLPQPLLMDGGANLDLTLGLPGAPAPNLELQLGPPEPEAGVELVGEDDLSPVERKVKDRLTLYASPEEEISNDDVEALVLLKGDVLERMAQLDPHPFWVENRELLISEYILTPRGPEYKLETLLQNLEELRGHNGSNSHFFRTLKKVREDWE